MSGIFTIIIFFTVIALTAAIFFGWTLFIVARTIFRAVFVMIGGEPWWRPVQRQVVGTIGSRCTTRGCHRVNPSDARFCRRCGRGLPRAQSVQVRRAAVW